MTIGDLEKAAGIENRVQFWAQFAHLTGSYLQEGKVRSVALDAGILELREMVAAKQRADNQSAK